MANMMLKAGPGEQHQDALPGRLAREGAGQLGRATRALALVQHLHVAAERQGGDDVFGVIRRAADRA